MADWGTLIALMIGTVVEKPGVRFRPIADISAPAQNGCMADEDGTRWQERLKKIARAKPK